MREPDGPKGDAFDEALGASLKSFADDLLADFDLAASGNSTPPPLGEPGLRLPEFVAPRSEGEDGLAQLPGIELMPPPALPDEDFDPAPHHRPSLIPPEQRIPGRNELSERPAPGPGAIIGIDLGTTNCCAAAVKDGAAFVLASRSGASTTPSVISFSAEGPVFVGQDAASRASEDPLRTIVGSKRMVGRPFHSPLVQSIRSHFAYPIVPGDEGEVAVDIGEELVTLEQVSAYLLKDIKESASLQLGEPVTRAVITCPAFYNERQREAVRVAGEMAGLKVERVLSEPTAAALNYGIGQTLQTRRVAVYDLGGGTFDVSILEVDGNVYEVLATGGDTFLGGIDFDACIAELIVEGLLEAGAPDPRHDAAALARIMQLAETAKLALSERPSTMVKVDGLRVNDAPPVSLSIPILRADADARLAPLLNQTLAIVREVCSRAQIEPHEVDEVLLVGGQTRSPIVRTAVEGLFRRSPRASVHPDEAVALGAAQYAAGMQSVDNVVLLDALAMSIGIGLPGGRFLKLIERDARLPADGSCLLPTAEQNQSAMEVWFYQGESEDLRGNEPLGSLQIRGLPPGPIGGVTVRIDLHVDEESVLAVNAVESTSGRVFTSRFATQATPPALRNRLQPALEQPVARTEQGPKKVWKWLTSVFRR
ncbi:MAG: Hsp70 family protein [Myxococcota bacterium]